MGLSLGEGGWVEVDQLLRAVNGHEVALTIEQLRHVVETNSKERFAFSEDGRRIRASQGHSVEVDLNYAPQMPPEILYHGTATRFLDAIRKDGLRKMEQHDVHLLEDKAASLQVGGRHGKPVLLTIRAGEMHRAGHVFRCSANGVWLVDHVPAEYIEFG